ncbi:MAG TPA: response regulator [Burkholderiales bacterium]|nr:response regulator [Burkholderiales bacterium]
MAVPRPLEQPTPPSGALCVLIVEDNAADAMIAAAAVARAASGPYVLMRAESLAQALDLIREHGADMVLMDLNLPDSRGIESLERVRAATASPVIVVTTEDAAGLDEAALAAGAFDILHKGRIDVEAIAALLRLAEKQRRARNGQ